MTKETSRKLRTEQEDSIEYVFHDRKNARGMIDFPEYFFIQPTPDEENSAKEDYETLWERLSIRDKVEVPRSIGTFVGKVRFIEEEFRFRECLERYNSPDYKNTGHFFSSNGYLVKERKEARKKLMLLSNREIAALRKKASRTFPEEKYPYPFNRFTEPLHPSKVPLLH